MARSISFICILSFFGFFADTSFAQADTTTAAQPETKSGSVAFLFAISGLAPFGLSAFPIKTFDSSAALSGLGTGNTVVYAGGGKWYISDFLALRGVLGITSTSKGDETSVSGKTTTLLWGISGGVEMHMTPIGSLSPYFGGQMSFGGASIANTVSMSGEETQTSKISGSNFGIGILWGFDWFFTRGLAIGGEVLYGYSRSSTTNEVNGNSTDGPTPSAITLSVGNVHLAVHF